ncbi:hypothetical protein [Streptomyces sp. NPDC057682]|uniref:hypothetical protein n=1 Tax=Streptomyces sp. NPDC057682 TaxID=3346210 RepID=UPI003694A94B
MSGDAVAAEAVRAIAGMASGAATAVGTGVGQLVADLVRRQIGGSPEGRAALTAVEERPEDPDAASALEEAVRADIAEHPAFGIQLDVALRGPRTTVNTGIQIGAGARIRRAQIALGPITVTNTPAARATLATLAAVLAAALAFGVYGVIRAAEDDPPRSRPGTNAPHGDQEAQDATSGGTTGGTSSAGDGGGAPAPDVRSLTSGEMEQVFAALPLPSGWAKDGYSESAADAMDLSNEARMGCWGLGDADPGENSGSGRMSTYGAGDDGFMINLKGHRATGSGTETDSAVTAMDALFGMYGCLPDAESVDIGDRAFSYTQPGYVYTWVRVGPMVAWLITADTAGRTSEDWARELVPLVRDALASR